jgi:hypothetical protein
VTGFHGTKICKVYKGTLLWHREDDEGVVHDTRISGSYYIPGGKHRLISPQHWTQQAEGRASCLTLHNRAILKWKDGQATKTVPIDSQNVFTFDLAPGYYTFSAFCMQAQYDHDRNDCNPATMPPASFEQNEETDTTWNTPDIPVMICNPATMPPASYEQSEETDTTWKFLHQFFDFRVEGRNIVVVGGHDVSHSRVQFFHQQVDCCTGIDLRFGDDDL